MTKEMLRMLSKERMVKIYTAPRWSLSLLKEKIDVVIDAMDAMVSVDVAMGDEVHQGL